MTEQELRSLVRDAIARHIGTPGTFAPSHFASSDAPSHLAPSHHFSHGLFVVPSGADSEGPCIIEPSVMCNHCGYCKSYGH
jgi:hypothetical protein